MPDGDLRRWRRSHGSGSRGAGAGDLDHSVAGVGSHASAANAVTESAELQQHPQKEISALAHGPHARLPSLLGFGGSTSGGQGRGHRPSPVPIADCSDKHTITTTDTCDALAATYGITLDTIYSLNNITDTTCSALSRYAGQLICVGDPVETGVYSPTPLANCTLEDTVLANDTCEALTDFYGISVDDLLAYNNMTNSTCQHLADFAGDPVCVSVGPLEIDAPTPVDSCARVYNVTTGDSCNSIAATNSLALDDLLTYNKITSLTCLFLTNFLGVNMCVAVTDPSASAVAATASSPAAIVDATALAASPSSTPLAEAVQAGPDAADSPVMLPDSSTPTDTPAAAPTEDPTPTPTPDAASSTPATAQVSSCLSCGQKYASGTDYGPAHSFFRGLYGLSGVTVDSGLEADATNAANYYNGGDRACGDITHDSSAGDAGEGENLWTGMSSSSDYQSTITINDAVNDWMSEDSDC
ncbi:hypothetical protein HK405_004571 [Cladochytrium tenue]|nr:hypothetical protein HK405_004571 [Cladochytrium tenue]